ncbi:sensor domain-containing diguanylate cyclase [Vibrio viridaestus]|uniref:diguanylate cyclase n=1 Tax=Vibrio viridaestus TaxID=2487322 RepID=A0A3N9TLX7_9VIBR|nr:cache domain-containing protein [Vibrio viridaestus]RQW65091.1 diguanylate cyclase [Vibrio viridaestus]
MKKKRLTFFVFFNVITVGSLALLITSLLWVNSIFDKYDRDSARIQEYHTNRVRDELKNRVDTIVSFINYRKETTETLLKDELRNRILEINHLINHLYNENKDELTRPQLTSLIRETIRGLRYNNGRGYYFIDTLDGDVILYPIAPKTEGTNQLDLQDVRGNYVLRDEIALVQKQGAGFVEGYWIKPGKSKKEYKKIAYVHEFKPLGWYFGTGEYVDVVRNQIQTEIKSYVNQLTYGKNNDQYVFIHDFAGTELANGRFPSLIDKNNINLQDENGEYVYKNQIDLVKKEPHYGFLTHHWPASDTDRTVQREKLTYVVSIPEWNWVIGSGADMTSLRQAIQRNQQELNEQLSNSIKNIILVTVGIFAISLIIAKIVATHINRSIRFFTRNLELSSDNLNPINKDRVVYREFEVLAEVSNKTTQRINSLLYHDGLTNLYNRRYIDTILIPYITNRLTSKTPVSVIMFDIDYFKRVNDVYGHHIGDVVLSKVAHTIQSEIRDQDFAARFGGEEILVVLPDTTEVEAFEIAEIIRIKVSQLTFEEIHFPITISGGVFCQNHSQCEELIKRADAKLYQAKHNGRDQIVA